MCIRDRYWDATHNVYAYIIRDGATRFSDDGEPCLLYTSKSLAAFVILYSPVKLPQAISRCEASYHCPKDNFTRRQANITEAHFLAECASSGPVCGSFCCVAQDALERAHGGLHVLDRDVLEPAVVILAAREQVRAGEPLVGQARAVRAAADGHDARRDARIAHGLLLSLIHIL